MAGQRGDLDVVEHGEPREGSHDLEGAREAEPADVVRLEPPEAPLAEPDLARVGSEKPREQVEDGGLPGPVGSDEADHLAVGHGQVEALHGEDASERKSTRLNSSHLVISYAVFCLKKKKTQ